MPTSARSVYPSPQTAAGGFFSYHETPMTNATRYPLSWPAGWKRSIRGGAKYPRFESRGRGITTYDATTRLDRELDRLGAREAILSTNLKLGVRGDPLSAQPEPDDRGVAVYFKLKGKERVLACDVYTTVAGNIAAIAAHIDALRRIDRYGVGTLDQAFAGYDALPPPGATAKITWRKVFGFAADSHVSASMVDDFYKTLAKQFRPDLQGGSTEAMAMLNAARDEALAELAA